MVELLLSPYCEEHNEDAADIDENSISTFIDFCRLRRNTNDYMRAFRAKSTIIF